MACLKLQVVQQNYSPLKVVHKACDKMIKSRVDCSMNNNPISYTDPEGDLAFAPILVGAAIGAGVSGATTIATNAIAGE